MTTTPIPIVTDSTQIIPAENHKKAAMHHEAAAKHHHDAAQHHDEGHPEKANESTLKAHGHQTLANEAHEEITKHHASKK